MSPEVARSVDIGMSAFPPLLGVNRTWPGLTTFWRRGAGPEDRVGDADHQNKPDLATSIARRWYDSDGVDMITELTTSSAQTEGAR
jgi:hypothetical protein